MDPQLLDRDLAYSRRFSLLNRRNCQLLSAYLTVIIRGPPQAGEEGPQPFPLRAANWPLLPPHQPVPFRIPRPRCVYFTVGGQLPKQPHKPCSLLTVSAARSPQMSDAEACEAPTLPTASASSPAETQGRVRRSKCRKQATIQTTRLLSAYGVPGTVLGPEDPARKKTNNAPALVDFRL